MTFEIFAKLLDHIGEDRLVLARVGEVGEACVLRLEEVDAAEREAPRRAAAHEEKLAHGRNEPGEDGTVDGFGFGGSSAPFVCSSESPIHRCAGA